MSSKADRLEELDRHILRGEQACTRMWISVLRHRSLGLDATKPEAHLRDYERWIRDLWRNRQSLIR